MTESHELNDWNRKISVRLNKMDLNDKTNLENKNKINFENNKKMNVENNDFEISKLRF